LAADSLDNFDVDKANGRILDFIGEWAGISRSLDVELEDVYFEWNGPEKTGWNRGNWRGPFDPLTGLSVLDDRSYRTILKVKIGSNNWDGTTSEISRIYNEQLLSNGTRVVVIDNFDMTMSLLFVGPSLTAVEEGIIAGMMGIGPNNMIISCKG
jgi:hypothetical protein